MKIHKLNIDEFDDQDYKLIALHSALEDYRIAYFINKLLNIRLEISAKDIEIETGTSQGFFSHYIYPDLENDVIWNLITNKTFFSSTTKENSPLFNETDTTFCSSIYLLPELKTVDYLLKIEEADDSFDIDFIIEKLNSLKFITTAYELHQNKIKSKNNLIF